MQAGISTDSFERETEFRGDSTAPLHLVHVVRSLQMGGQEMMLSRLVESLDPKRFRCSVVALRGGGPLAERLQERGTPVHCPSFGEGFSPGLMVALWRLLRREQADIIHCHNVQPLVYAGIARLGLSQCRLLLTVHGFPRVENRRVRPLLRRLYARTDAVVAVTAGLQGALRLQGCPQNRLQVILNGVDTDRFRPCADREARRTALGFGETDRVIGTVGRLSPEKDPENLVRAMRMVADSEPRARAVFVGDGAVRSSLEALARRLHLEDHVRFWGERPDISTILPALDAFCLPSRTEGTSLSLLEAMACELPVVATAVGGTPAAVGNGAAALLVPPGNPEALAAALLRILREPDTAGSLARTGRRIAQSEFSLRRMAEGYADLYTRLCLRGEAAPSQGTRTDCTLLRHE